MNDLNSQILPESMDSEMSSSQQCTTQPNPESLTGTPIADYHSVRIDEIWKAFENGDVELTEAEKALAEKAVLIESKTPIMGVFAKELDQFWEDAHAGKLVFTETEKRLARRLLELFPDNLLTNPKK